MTGSILDDCSAVAVSALPPDLAWVVVVPVKSLATAKSRLEPAVEGQRPALARAFAVDTVAALAAVPAVRVIVVVSGDQHTATTPWQEGVVVIDEPVPGGLNAAATAGISWARAHHPDAAVAVVSSDLPSLRRQDAEAVLQLAASHSRAVVPDREGTGTTLLSARPGVELRPRFGHNSLSRHRAAGAIVVDTVELVRVTRDVDTASHLAEAVRLGVGQATARVLDS